MILGLTSNVVTRTWPGCGEPEPDHGVDDGERLDRLHRIEVVALPLVDEVEARPDDANAADAAGGQQPVGQKDRERLLDAEAGIDRGVRGEPAVLEERRPRRVAHGLLADEIGLPAVLGDHACRPRGEPLAEPPPGVRGGEIDRLPSGDDAGELEPLIPPWRRQGVDEVLDPRPHGIRCCPAAAGGGDVALGERGPVGEHGAEEGEIEDRVLVARGEACSDVPVTRRDPGRPVGRQLRRGLRLQLGGQPSRWDRFENRPRGGIGDVGADRRAGGRRGLLREGPERDHQAEEGCQSDDRRASDTEGHGRVVPARATPLGGVTREETSRLRSSTGR